MFSGWWIITLFISALVTLTIQDRFKCVRRLLSRPISNLVALFFVFLYQTEYATLHSIIIDTTFATNTLSLFRIFTTTIKRSRCVEFKMICKWTHVIWIWVSCWFTTTPYQSFLWQTILLLDYLVVILLNMVNTILDLGSWIVVKALFL